MDNSLIPRAFSPTDAKRRAEENARESERRSSARNASSSAIGAGGKLTLAGGIEVVEGGTVDVIGLAFTDLGAPYEVRSELTTVDVETNYGVGASPTLKFSTGIFGDSARARLYSIDGRQIDVEGYEAGSGIGRLTAERDGCTGWFGDDGPAYGDATGKYREASMYAGRYGFSMKFSDGVNGARSGIVADGNGNIDIQTTGALTQNGAPLSGGGGAVSSVAGKTGAVTLVKADVGLSNVDNTADLAKPVSTATQTALNGKANTAHTHAIADTTGLQTALDGKASATVYHAEFKATGSVPANTNHNPTFTLDAANSDNPGTICQIMAAGQIKILVTGNYSCDWLAIHGGTAAGANAYMNIRIPDQTTTFSMIDIPSNSGGSLINFASRKLQAGTILTFSCYFGAAMPSLVSNVIINKHG